MCAQGRLLAELLMRFSAMSRFRRHWECSSPATADARYPFEADAVGDLPRILEWRGVTKYTTTVQLYGYNARVMVALCLQQDAHTGFDFVCSRQLKYEVQARSSMLGKSSFAKCIA